MGKCLIMGDGIEKDVEEGIFNLNKSTELGNNTASYLLGEYYLSQNDVDKATEYYLLSMQSGNLLSALRISKIYLDSDKEEYHLKACEELFRISSLTSIENTSDSRTVASAQLKLWLLNKDEKKKHLLQDKMNIPSYVLLNFLNKSAENGNMISQV